MKKIYLLALMAIAFPYNLHAEIDMWQFRAKADFMTWNDYGSSYDTLYFVYLSEDAVALLSVGTSHDSIEIPSSVMNDGVTYHVTTIFDSAFYAIEYLHASLSKIILPYSITHIGYQAFQECKSLASINIPEGVRSIDPFAFDGCSSLKRITIPTSIYEIREWTFRGCTSLDSLTIPSNILYINYEAFKNCIGLKSLEFKQGLRELRMGAFDGCINLKNIILPNSLTTIGSAFTGCSNLVSVEIPSSVTNIEGHAFANCSKLSSISIPFSVQSIGSGFCFGCSNLSQILVDEDNPNYCSIDGVLFSKDEKTLIQYAGGKLGAYIIPQGVTRVEEEAFREMTNLTFLVIPSSITNIGQTAFIDCSQLEIVECYAEVPPQIESLTFTRLNESAILYVPDASVSAYKAISNYASKFSKILSLKLSHSEVFNLTSTSVVLKWLADSAVIQYDINIFQDATLFAHYVVDGDGHITSSQRFVPSIYHQKLDTTTSSTDYFVITLNGLSAGTDYDYTIDGTDAQSSPVYHEEGTFTTLNEDEDGFFDAIADDHKKQMQKILQEGQLYIIQGEDMITIQGIKVNQ